MRGERVDISKKQAVSPLGFLKQAQDAMCIGSIKNGADGICRLSVSPLI